MKSSRIKYEYQLVLIVTSVYIFTSVSKHQLERESCHCSSKSSTKGLQQTNPKQIQFNYNSTNSPINHRLLTSTQPDRNQIKVKKKRLPVTSIDKSSKHTTHQHKLFITCSCISSNCT